MGKHFLIGISVRLVNGDPTYYGAVYTSLGVNNGPICSVDFDEVDACKYLTPSQACTVY